MPGDYNATYVGSIVKQEGLCISIGQQNIGMPLDHIRKVITDTDADAKESFIY